MSAKKRLSKEELLSDDSIETRVVEAYGQEVVIGTLSSYDMIRWFEENEDKSLRREAGLRILVRSLVVSEEVKERLFPEPELEMALAKFRRKNSVENAKVIKAALELNGLASAAARAAELAKNALSEAPTDASPTA